MNLDSVLLAGGQQVQRTINEIFEDRDCEIRSLDDSSDFEEAINETSPDLLLVDLDVHSDIHELIDEIRSHSGAPELLLLADRDDRDTAISLMSKGAFDYVEKPIDKEELLTRARHAVENSSLKKQTRHIEMEEGEQSHCESHDEDPLSPSYLFHVLMEQIPDAVYFKDEEGRFLYVSQALVEKHGLSDPEEIKGKTDFDFFSDEHARRAYEDEQKIMETGEPTVGREEKETWHSGDETWASVTKAPLIGPDGEILGTIGISRDITRRKNVEEKMKNYMERLEADLSRAQTVQRTLLPSKSFSHDYLNVAYRFQPFEQISGDFLSLHPLNGNQLGAFVVDVSGHGLSAALFMALIKFLTDRHAPDLGTTPAKFLEKINEELMEEKSHPSKFVTGLFGCFEPLSNEEGCRATFAKAGHPDPVLFREQDREATFLNLDSASAIGLQSEFSSETTDTNLQSGDRVFLYTDGLSDAQISKEQFLPDETFLELIEQSQKSSLQATLDQIIASVDMHSHHDQFEDDVVLCAVEVPETKNG